MLFVSDFLSNYTDYYYIVYEVQDKGHDLRNFRTPFVFDSCVDAIAFFWNTGWYYVSDGSDTFQKPGDDSISAFILKQDTATTGHQVRDIMSSLDAIERYWSENE